LRVNRFDFKPGVKNPPKYFRPGRIFEDRKAGLEETLINAGAFLLTN